MLPPAVRHEQHQALGHREAHAEHEHGDGDGDADKLVEPGEGPHRQQGQHQHEEAEEEREGVEGVGEDLGQEGREVAGPHDAAYAGVILEPVRRYQGAQHGGEGGHVDRAGTNSALVPAMTVAVAVGVVRRVRAHALEDVLEVVAQQVEAAEDKEDAHGEAGQHLDALQAEGVPDGAAPPHLEVAQHIDAHADGGGPNVEEDQVRERRHGEGPSRAEENVAGHAGVAQAPVQPDPLVLMHRAPCFLERRHGEGGGEDGRRSRWWLLEDLVLGAYGRVFVPVATALADVLVVVVNVSQAHSANLWCIMGWDKRTDLTGEVDMDWVWKLKGPGAGAAGTSPFSERADSVDILLAGRLMLRGVSGRRREALFGESSKPPMSFQLPMLLVALAREAGRSTSKSLSRARSRSTTSSSGGGSTSRGGVGDGGGKSGGRPDAMCLSRTGRRHGEEGRHTADLSL